MTAATATTDDERPLLALPLKVFLFLPDPAGTIAGGYDTLAMRRSIDRGVTFEDLVDERLPIKLDANTCNYFFIDVEAEEGYLYEPVLVDSTGTNPDVPQPPRQALNTEFEVVLTVDELRKIYLFGVDLTDDNGNPFPDELFVHYIKTGISQIEHELDLALSPTKYNENYDFWIREYERYMFVQLAQKPIVSVERVALEYPSGSLIIEFPLDWVRVKHAAGQIEVLPARGTFTQLLVSAGGGFLPLVFGGSDYIPDIINVQYTAGFIPDDRGFGSAGLTEAQRLPHAIKEVVGKKAAFGPFNTAGDLIVGAGIANRSISIDGLSQTIGTTSSATNAGYGARLIQYEKELKEAIPALRRYYRGARMTVA